MSEYVIFCLGGLCREEATINTYISVLSAPCVTLRNTGLSLILSSTKIFCITYLIPLIGWTEIFPITRHLLAEKPHIFFTLLYVIWFESWLYKRCLLEDWVHITLLNTNTTFNIWKYVTTLILCYLQTQKLSNLQSHC